MIKLARELRENPEVTHICFAGLTQSAKRTGNPPPQKSLAVFGIPSFERGFIDGHSDAVVAGVIVERRLRRSLPCFGLCSASDLAKKGREVSQDDGAIRMDLETCFSNRDGSPKGCLCLLCAAEYGVDSR